MSLPLLPDLLQTSLVNIEALIKDGPIGNCEEESRFNNHNSGGIVTEATKITGKVMMNSDLLVTQFMDEKKWRDMFFGVVRSCSFDESSKWKEEGDGEVAINGVTVRASLVSLSPMIPSKEIHFTRLCKKTENGTLIVDAQLIRTLENKFVSGCRIEAISDTESKVTFVIHRIYKISSIPEDYKNLMKTALSSVRWFATLKRECERRAIHGGFFSPVVFQDDAVRSYWSISRSAMLMRYHFSYVLTHEPSYNAGLVNFRHRISHSALMSIKVKASIERTFMICKRFIMLNRGQHGVETQFPESVNYNCVSIIRSDTEERTLLETYMDASEALLVYASQAEPELLQHPSGFSIQPDGIGESYLTVAIVAKLEPDKVNSWKTQVQVKIHRLLADLEA